MVHFDFVIVIDFDYSYWGVLLFWIFAKTVVMIREVISI